ncbi:MAG: methylmalonyl Co-A mutase-associated GTPase MeaB [Acidimicrobiia bacterium]|nr:methylmalonyl Co-A mutase-associated GTPase MeaB [Acidimicrobiia bacterium]
MDDLIAAVLAGDRTAIGRAITLVESTRPDDRRLAQELLSQLLPHAGGANRVGISGVPGAGKSTLIDALGTRLTGAGHRVGVLAVDPSSMVTGGSILGDKSRMATLSADEKAFIRPSPSAGMLGGVTSTTPHAIAVLEAAGYDVVLVETMGVGQSEAAVHASVDCLCVLALAGAGDELQAVKRGLLELADVVVVNKADGDNERAARLAAAEFRRALPLLAPTGEGGPPEVMTVSAATGAGVDELWDCIVEHRRALDTSGALAQRRARGRLAWMRVLLERRLVEQFEAQPGTAERRSELEHAVEQGQITPEAAVEQLLSQS